MNYSYKEIAALKNVSVSAVYSAINRGKLISTSSKKIDIDNPVNRLWLSKIKHQYNRNEQAKQNKKEVNSNSLFIEYLDYCNECKELEIEFEPFDQWKRDKEQSTKPIISNEIQDQIGLADLEVQQKLADVEWKKHRSEALAFKRAKEEGLVVDIITVRQKMRAYANILNTELIPFAENIAAIVVSICKESDDPEFEVMQALKKPILDILKKAKKAANNICLEEKNIEYYLSQNED
jgi:hypothetical protein